MASVSVRFFPSNSVRSRHPGAPHRRLEVHTDNEGDRYATTLTLIDREQIEVPVTGERWSVASMIDGFGSRSQRLPDRGPVHGHFGHEGCADWGTVSPRRTKAEESRIMPP